MGSDEEIKSSKSLQPTDIQPPSRLPGFPRLPSQAGIFGGPWWDALRYEAARRQFLRYGRAWHAVEQSIRALRETEDEYVEYQRALARAADIGTILETDRLERIAALDEASHKRELASLKADAEAAKLGWERVKYEQEQKPKDYEEVVFEKQLQKFRSFIKHPKRLWDEYYKHREAVITARGGEDKLTPEDEDELRRAKDYVQSLLDSEQV